MEKKYIVKRYSFEHPKEGWIDVHSGMVAIDVAEFLARIIDSTGIYEASIIEVDV